MSLGINKTIILRRQLPPRIFTPDNHWDDQTCNSQADESTRNEHVLNTIPIHPWIYGKWNTNARSISDKCNTCERVAGNLSLMLVPICNSNVVERFNSRHDSYQLPESRQHHQ